MNRVVKVIFCLWLLVGILPVSQAAAGSEIVEKVHVTITAAEGEQAPPERIAKRMAASVHTIGEHVLLGRRISDIADSHASYERIVREVFDRILVGYTVEDVSLEPGEDMGISLTVRPWGDVVRDVAVEIDFGTISPDAVILLHKDIGNIEKKLADALIGLPIDTLDWAGGVSKAMVRDVLAEQLPEFRVTFDIVSGASTIVKLSLMPTGQLVQDTQVSLRSHTIPNILLLQFRSGLEDTAKSLNGLPVAFVERHRDYFTAKVAAALANKSTVKRYGLTVTPILSLGPTTNIIMQTETDRYKVTLEGYLDMGRKNDNTSARLHTGKMISKTDEIFLETDFIPGTVSWKFSPGWGRRIGQAEVGFKYDSKVQNGVLWLVQNIGPAWQMRVERSPEDGRNEMGLRYKLHDFINLEYVYTTNEKYLRLVGNL